MKRASFSRRSRNELTPGSDRFSIGTREPNEITARTRLSTALLLLCVPVLLLCALPATADSNSEELGSRARHEWVVGGLDPDHDDGYAYRLPYGDGVSYAVLQGYGSGLSHQGPEHFTVDFQMPEGTPVHASRDGVVVLVEESNSRGCWAERCDGLANYVVILHSDGTTGEYFHLAQNGVLVGPGDQVAAGQMIAVSGNTGYTTTPHLHFGVYGAHTRGHTQSIGVRFRTRSGVVSEMRPGARHLNAD